MVLTDEVQPLIEAPGEFAEDTDTKSIRVPVVKVPLPDPVPAPRVDPSELVLPARPSLIRRVFPLPPVKRRRAA